MGIGENIKEGGLKMDLTQEQFEFRRKFYEHQIFSCKSSIEFYEYRLSDQDNYSRGKDYDEEK